MNEYEKCVVTVDIEDIENILRGVDFYEPYLKVVEEILQKSVPHRINDTLITVEINTGPHLTVFPDEIPDFSINIHFCLNKICKTTGPLRTVLSLGIYEPYSCLKRYTVEQFKNVFQKNLQDILLKILKNCITTEDLNYVGKG